MFGIFGNKQTEELRNFKATIRGIIGSSPRNIELYQLAVRHSSTGKDSNERLEYLGDAILGSIIAEYLFKKFPYKDEGFLTEIRSRIVKRETLNQLAQNIGLSKLVQYNTNRGTNSPKSLYGNALEAFIGAIYLDKGHRFCTKYVIEHLVKPNIDLKDLIENNTNYKSILIEWAQKNGIAVEFNIINEEGSSHSKTFTSQVSVDHKVVSEGAGPSKKKAEQAAAQRACEQLSLN